MFTTSTVSATNSRYCTTWRGGDTHKWYVYAVCMRLCVVAPQFLTGTLQIRLLLQSGLKHDIVDSSGDTPLHWCATRSHSVCTLYLRFSL